MKKVTACLWCNNNELEFVTQRIDNVGILKCNKCSLLMNQEIPQDLAGLYNENYYSASEASENKGYEGVYYLVSPAFLLWQNSFIEEINNQHKQKEFLEIGSATGGLLEILRENQPYLRLSGVDISEYAVQVTTKKGFDTKVGFIQELSLSPKKDIIFSSETLEHLDDLRSFLLGVKRNLKRGGTFLFYVPSIVEEDARREGPQYRRFTSNMEHLLHFTPEFFKNSLPEVFGSNVMIKEFRTSFGPCILGAVSDNANNYSALQKLFSAIETRKVPANPTDNFLKNLSIFCMKFGYSDFAEEVIAVIEKRTNFNKQDHLLIKGLRCYHRGELEKASEYFGDFLNINPTSQIGIKLLLSNEKELSQIYREEIYKLKNEPQKLFKKLSKNKR